MGEGSVEYLNKCPDNRVEMYHKVASGSMAKQAACVTELLHSLKIAHQEAINEILSELDKKINNWTHYLQVQHPGTLIDNTVINRARDIIRNHSIHIGEDALEANTPLIEAIKKLKIKVEGNVAAFDAEKLKQVIFPEQPYAAIERKALAKPLRRSDRSNKGQRR